MCLSLLRNKFFWLGLIIYFLPSIVVFSYLFSWMPSNQVHYGESTETSPMFSLVAFILLSWIFIALPVLLVLTHWFILIPYFTVSYALLYLYYRQGNRKQSPKEEAILV